MVYHLRVNRETTHLTTDVLIIGAGAAGMSAAIAAHDSGARVMLIDRSLIGRGGATVMAQMTVAAALGDEVADDWRRHFADTIKAGRAIRTAACVRPKRPDTTVLVASMSIFSTPGRRCPGHCARKCSAVLPSCGSGSSQSSISSSRMAWRAARSAFPSLRGEPSRLLRRA